MYICYSNTIWGYLFSFSEITSIALLAYLYTRHTLTIRRTNEIQNYENLDLIIIFLSIFQVYLMLFSLIFSNNFGFSILQEISKFTQNIIICGCLLLQIFLWQKYPIAIYIIKNYVFIFTLFNVFILLCGFFFEYNFLELNFCNSVILKILPVLGFVFNLLLITMAVYNNYQEQNESQKNGALIYENDNLGAIIDKYASSLQKMRKYYLIFIIYFTVSYFVDVYFKFSNIKYDDTIINNYGGNANSSFNGNLNKAKGYENKNIDGQYTNLNYKRNLTETYFNKERIDGINYRKLYDFISKNTLFENKNLTNQINNYVFIKKESYLEDENKANFNASKNFNNNYNKQKVFITRYITACEYYKDLGDKHSLKELLVCFISFVFRDIGPHIYIFISLFVYKPETLSRSSSFIEI